MQERSTSHTQPEIRDKAISDPNRLLNFDISFTHKQGNRHDTGGGCRQLQQYLPSATRK